jgi:hypothetical protein
MTGKSLAVLFNVLPVNRLCECCLLYVSCLFPSLCLHRAYLVWVGGGNNNGKREGEIRNAPIYDLVLVLGHKNKPEVFSFFLFFFFFFFSSISARPRPTVVA